MRRKTEPPTHPASDAKPHDERPVEDEPPPFGGSWAKLYAFVLVNLLVLIALFYIFTKAFE
ncbi:MAG TPA: hypothetical protein VGB73_18635 [Pyrinomonadaceae bacterium]|jgi:hypothetical protein